MVNGWPPGFWQKRADSVSCCEWLCTGQMQAPMFTP